MRHTRTTTKLKIQLFVMAVGIVGMMGYGLARWMAGW